MKRLSLKEHTLCLIAQWRAKADLVERELGASIASGDRAEIVATYSTLRRCARELDNAMRKATP